jgi:acetyl-CoA acyltransferase
MAGHYNIAVAGGVESMSRIPMFSAITVNSSPLGEMYSARYGTTFPNQGLGADSVARTWGISRQALDEFSLRSHYKAAAAQDAGQFDDEIVPVTLAAGAVIFPGLGRAAGREPREARQSRSRLRHRRDRRCGERLSDHRRGAALLMMTSSRARDLGLRPMARIHTAVMGGAAPMPMLTAPIPATQKLLARSGVLLREIGTFEVNEAFASVPLAWMRELAPPRRGSIREEAPSRSAIHSAAVGPGS